jgi:histidinol phosphatase-like PHP family hydrolase
MALSNGEIAELFAREAQRETGHRARALRRGSRAALAWAREAEEVAARGSLTELAGIGPWLAATVHRWLESPPEVPEAPPARRGFLTMARARAIVGAAPHVVGGLPSDLQMHTTWSDGRATMREMVEACAGLGYTHVLVTDHSKGLPIARGMDEARLARQGLEVAQVNGELQRGGSGIRVLHGIEMNLGLDGAGDMDPGALARLDVVLGAFHSRLRVTDDQTDRYLAAVRNPRVHVLAHPRCRMYDRRRGLAADWDRVFAEAAALGKAVEVDANPYRQDIDADLLEVAREAGAWISIGTDAHSIGELGFIELGLAALILARFPPERVLNTLPPEELRAWARAGSGAT